MPKKPRKPTSLDEPAMRILAELLGEFRQRSLKTEDLQNGYKGLSLVSLKSSCCADGQISDVDFDLAMKDLNEAGLLETGPMAAYDNIPGSDVFIMSLYSKNEYAYLTEEGYKRATRLSTSKPGMIPAPHASMTQASSIHEDRPLRVFISYSWDSEEHKKWVSAFARQLRKSGIDAIIDQTHLLLGARTPEFMECSVRESVRVLVVCTDKYKQRFDNRKGGAGYEGHIITGEIVNEVGKNKFIPILRSGDWKSAIPTALSGVNGVDLLNDSAEEYRRLIENLHNVPLISAVGPRPVWLDSQTVPTLTGHNTEMPLHRPKIRALRYGSEPPHGRSGLIITNDGEIAYDISIPDVRFGAFILKIECDLPRLTHSDGDRLCQAWIEKSPDTHSTGNNLFDEMVCQHIADVEIPIYYKDEDNRWYMTLCKVERNVKTSGGLNVRYIAQELVERSSLPPVAPEHPSLRDIKSDAPSGAPELIIDYHYSDRPTPQPWSPPDDKDKPITVRNVTREKNAYNVRILPLVTTDGTVEFEPSLVNCIAGDKQAEFNGRMQDGHIFWKNHLLQLFESSYKDSSTDELFTPKSFMLQIEYDDLSGNSSRKFVADCEILYTKWHNVIQPGKHAIRRIS